MMMKKVMAINPPAPPKNAFVMFVEPGSGAFDDTVLLACRTRARPGRPAIATSIQLPVFELQQTTRNILGEILEIVMEIVWVTSLV